MASLLVSPTPATASAPPVQKTLTICTSLKSGHQIISKSGKCNERIYESRTWYQKGAAPSGTPGSDLLDLRTCVSKRSNLQMIRTISACNSKTQTTSLWQRPLGPPAAPMITSVAMGILGTATLEISAPKEDGGARVTSYLVTSAPGEFKATYKPDQIKAAKFSGLIPGKTYSFMVVAINSKGSSPASISSKPTLAPTIPSAPTITKVVATGANTAQLTFTAHTNDGGSPITSYVATSNPGGLQTTVYQSASGTINISNLTHSTTYAFTLVAINAAGASPESAYSSFITTATPPPPSPPVVATPTPTPTPTPTVISVAAISGVSAPVTGATPVTTTTAGTGYTGTVSWSGSPSTFAAATTYTATITLTPTSGYTLTGVTANFFTVPGASPVTHSADSGEIIAVFPATASSTKEITTFTVSGQSGSSTITSTGNTTGTIAITVPNATNVTALVATFTHTGSSIAIASVAQVSATTANNFTSPVSYVVTAADGSTKTWSVTITVADLIAQSSLSITTLTTTSKAYPYSRALSISTSGGSGSGATTFAIASGGTATGCALSNSTSTATITATTVGTCLIQASKAADSTYSAATSPTATFTFTTATQTVTFTRPGIMKLGQGTQSVAPTASSSLTVTLTSTTTGVCTVAGFVITAVAIGTCSITASQSGNANYSAAISVTQNFIVEAIISTAAIAGVTPPVAGATPATTITPGIEYTGTVSWSRSPSTFAAATGYTATITLTPTSGYTLTGVASNFFTVAGATTVTHPGSSGVITAVFSVYCDGSSITCQAGDIGPGGGVIYYVAPTSFACGPTLSNTCKYLEAAPTTGDNAWTDAAYMWSGNPHELIGGSAQRTEIGTGYANTLAIVAQPDELGWENERENTAAKISQAYRGPNNKSDWYLPSKDELNQMCYWARGYRGAALTNITSVCPYFDGRDVSPEFAAASYWSSTEESAFGAWKQNFGNGLQAPQVKQLSIIEKVRPIRAFAGVAPAFTLSSSSESRTVNSVATGFTINSTGGAIASFAISATPPGMSFSTSTGALTGTPNTVASSTSYTITATNAVGSASQTFTLTVSAVVYTVGNTGPGGGKIFYVAATPFACGPTGGLMCTYLEAAPSGWNTGADPGRSWAQSTPVNYQGATVNNASSPETATATAIGWGYRNTRAIVLQGNTDTATSAAALADSYTVTVSSVVYDDWFLPSKDELNELYLQRALVGGFVADDYWSSSEKTENKAWYQIFIDGYQTEAVKSASVYVRPIRAFGP